MSQILEIRNLSLRIDSVSIFNDVHLKIEPGQFHSILGLSGVGKTQLLRTLAGLNEQYPPGTLLNQPISFVFQKSQLFPWLTIFQNLKITTGQDEQKIDHWLQKVELLKNKDQFPDQLSVGMQQKVNLVRAFLTPASVVLMDEPFAGLDHANKENLYCEMLSLWQETQCTIIFVTHDIEESLSLSQVLYLFSKKEKKIIRRIENPHSYPRKLYAGPFQNFYSQTYKEIENFLLEDFR